MYFVHTLQARPEASGSNSLCILSDEVSLLSGNFCTAHPLACGHYFRQQGVKIAQSNVYPCMRVDSHFPHSSEQKEQSKIHKI